MSIELLTAEGRINGKVTGCNASCGGGIESTWQELICRLQRAASLTLQHVTIARLSIRHLHLMTIQVGNVVNSRWFPCNIITVYIFLEQVIDLPEALSLYKSDTPEWSIERRSVLYSILLYAKMPSTCLRALMAVPRQDPENKKMPQQGVGEDKETGPPAKAASKRSAD